MRLVIKMVWMVTVALLLLLGAFLFPRLVQRRESSGPTPTQRAAWAKSSALAAQAWEVWRKEKDFPRAESLYREAMALDKRDAFLRQSYADMLAAEGRTSEAFVIYSELVRPPRNASYGLEMDPLTLSTYVRLSKAVGKPWEAQWGEEQIVLRTWQRYREYPKVTPEQLKSLPVSGMANLAVGLSLRNRGLQTEALEWFTQTTKAYPNLALGHLYRGQQLERTIGFGATAAKVEYEEALRLGDATVRAAAAFHLQDPAERHNWRQQETKP